MPERTFTLLVLHSKPTSTNQSSMNADDKDHATILQLELICYVTVAGVGCFLNSGLILLVSTSEKLRRRRSNKFLLSLISSHLVIGGSVLILFIRSLLLNLDNNCLHPRRKPLYQIVMFNLFFQLCVSNLIGLSVDRLLSVVRPFCYFNSVSTRHVQGVILLPWVICGLMLIVIIVELSAGLSSEWVKIVVFIFFDMVVVVGLFILILSNSLLFREARRQLISISQTTASENGKKKERKLHQKECKLALISIGTVLKFCVLWMPLIVSMALHQYKSEVRSHMMQFMVLVLVLLNTVLDPLIYVSTSNDIKKVLAKKLFTRKNVDSSSPSYHTQTTSR